MSMVNIEALCFILSVQVGAYHLPQEVLTTPEVGGFLFRAFHALN
ncbi:hypothetical protein FHR92_004434 [Fontibacillus solani]|uniref:Uncharacterized protein n=1 Tax=Fontibacillus solani TaxID=1572857 RepID=A0A7W3SXA6_9BACL|nr:hypothetical protein [Fontibacillus solani]